jgi:rhamnosyl/mannosyltransferase
VSSALPPSGLRICHLGKFYPPAPGGMETHVRALAESQAALGASVSVLCVSHTDARGVDVTHRALAGTQKERTLSSGVEVVRMSRWAQLARLDVCPAVLEELAERADFDIWHLHAPNPLFQLALLRRLTIPPLVVTHHCDVVRLKLLGKAFKPVEEEVYRRAALLLSTTRPYAESSPVLKKFREKVRTLPLGIDLAPFLNPSDETLQAQEGFAAQFGEPLWLMVGRLVYYKGFETALRALRRVPGHLLVVGTGPLRGALERRIAAMRLSSRVTFTGHLQLPQLAGAYRAATALWFPSESRAEAFGLSQVEAMASGCVVINARVEGSGVHWVSPHGETGFTIRPGDSVELSDACFQLLEDDGLRQRLGAKGKARARAEFEQGIMARRSLALYQEVLSARAPRETSHGQPRAAKTERRAQGGAN